MIKLNPKIFDEDIELESIRKGFGEGLVIAGEADERVVGLCADLTESTQMLSFKKKFPKRFIEVGVAEQNLAGVASGMAASGKIPFITSYAMFSPGRNWEQIRTTIAYNNRPVKIVGSHAGVSVGQDGGTHQAIEDIAITRVIPRMVVISPCDAIEARKATIALAKTDSPTYIRLARRKNPNNYDRRNSISKLVKPNYFLFLIILKRRELSELGLLRLVPFFIRLLKLPKNLKTKEKLAFKFLNLSTIKPLDEEAVIALAKSTEGLVTVEEHQVAGGMGSAVAECLAKNHPTKIKFIGVQDQFGQSGTPEELLEHYGMGEKDIEGAVRLI